MDIEEIKKYAKNKIEANDITKQVRKQIKETIWEKQNQREGFTETFKPLISQFEKPEDPKTKNIFTQNQEMLRNQLALTEGLKDNQKAITQGFSQFERLADMKELPGVEAIYDDQEQTSKNLLDFDDNQEQTSKNLIDFDDNQEQTSKFPIAKFDVDDLDKHLNNKKSKDILKSFGYHDLPSTYLQDGVNTIRPLFVSVNTDLNDLRPELKNVAEIITDEEGFSFALAKANKRGPTEETKDKIDKYNTLSLYSAHLKDLLIYKENSGSGMFYFSNPQELLKRFELLNGSLAAGNNGVLPEYIQIAHRLRDHGIITNNQLSTLLRKVGRLAHKII